VTFVNAKLLVFEKAETVERRRGAIRSQRGQCNGVGSVETVSESSCEADSYMLRKFWVMLFMSEQVFLNRELLLFKYFKVEPIIYCKFGI